MVSIPYSFKKKIKQPDFQKTVDSDTAFVAFVTNALQEYVGRHMENSLVSIETSEEKGYPEISIKIDNKKHVIVIPKQD